MNIAEFIEDQRFKFRLKKRGKYLLFFCMTLFPTIILTMYLIQKTPDLSFLTIFETSMVLIVLELIAIGYFLFLTHDERLITFHMDYSDKMWSNVTDYFDNSLYFSVREHNEKIILYSINSFFTKNDIIITKTDGNKLRIDIPYALSLEFEENFLPVLDKN